MIGPRHAVTVSAAIELPVELAADRLPVFPCAATKAPICAVGLKAATGDPKIRTRPLAPTPRSAHRREARRAVEPFPLVGSSEWERAASRSNRLFHPRESPCPSAGVCSCAWMRLPESCLRAPRTALH